MKLYNKTRCPDELLRPLLAAAGKSVGVRISEVVVKVTQGHYARSHGEAANDNLVYTWHLKKYKSYRTKDGYTKNPGRLIRTDGGWVRITLPGTSCHSFKIVNGIEIISFISQAEDFYEVAQHEWAHIKDYQQGNKFSSPRTPSGRRVAWRERPVEIAAMNSVHDAKQIDGQDDLILGLALWLEEQYHAKEILKKKENLSKTI